MSWKLRKLGELIDNFSIRAKDYGNSVGLPFLGVSNEVGITNTKYAAEEKAEDYKVIEKGCFAYNPYRINVGSIGYLNEDIKGLISPAYVVFKAKEDQIIPELLLKFLKSDEGLHQIKINARGTVRQALRFEDLSNIDISLPYLEEQKVLFNRITQIDEISRPISEQLNHQLDLIKNLRQTFLREAMQGKLVKQNHCVEPASFLLKRIKSEKDNLIKKKKIKKQNPLPAVFDKEIPFEIPDGWVWCRLGELLNELLGGFAFKSDNYIQHSKNQVIRLGNVKNNEILLDNNPVFISDEYSKIAKNVKLMPGDILITMTGTRAKKDYLFTLLLSENHFREYNLYLNQRVGCFRLNEFVNKEFINYLLKEPMILEPVFLSSTGAANQANIGVAALNNILVPLPPIAIQEKIVSKLNILMLFCTNIEASILASQQQNDLLLQRILRDALGLKSSVVQEPGQISSRENIISYKYNSNTLLMEIQELLKIHGKLQASELWQMSKFYGKTDEERNIDGFYAELKRLIEKDKVVKETEKGYLELV